MPTRPWPAGFGVWLAVIVLLACLAAAFLGGVHVTNLDLWLAGLLAVAIILG